MNSCASLMFAQEPGPDVLGTPTSLVVTDALGVWEKNTRKPKRFVPCVKSRAVWREGKSRGRGKDQKNRMIKGREKELFNN